MMRSMILPALAVAMMGGAALAEEPAPLAGNDYYADGSVPINGSLPTDGSVPIDGNCPGGNCPDGFGGAHGFGLHHHHYHSGGWGLAYASGYPNGVMNYGIPPYIRDWRGPGLGCRTCSNGECLYRFYGQPDLFYNYYAWPSCTGLGAALYVSPRPVPPWVGQTYITYQPFYPHEYMYGHHRTYHRYYNGGQGLNRTHVAYWHSWLPWR